MNITRCDICGRDAKAYDRVDRRRVGKVPHSDRERSYELCLGTGEEPGCAIMLERYIEGMRDKLWQEER